MASSKELASSLDEGSDSASPPHSSSTAQTRRRRRSLDRVYIGPSASIHKLYDRDGTLHTEDHFPLAEYQNKHSVLWVAEVFNAKNRESVRQNWPLAIYHSSSDFRITLGNGQNDMRSTSNEDEHRLAWEYSIFGIFIRATAHFPLQEESSGINMRNFPINRYVTNNFQSLVFENATQSEIRIFSPFLCSGLETIAGYYPHFFQHAAIPFHLATIIPGNTGKPILSFPYPWTFLLHRFPEIEGFVQGGGMPPTHLAGRSADALNLEREHMQVLYDFLKPYYEKNVLPYLEQLQQLSSECLFSFDKLCFVFKPGMDVYVQAGDSIKAMVVVGIKCNLDYNFEAEAKLTQTELQYWNLELWYLASDGENIGRQPTSCRIDSFQGLKQLIDLEACPASVWDAHDGGAQRKRLMQRGRLLFKALQNGHLLADYRGPVKGGAKHYSGPMIVDIRRGMVFSKLQPPQFGHVMEGPHSPRIFEGYDNIYVYDVKNEVDDSWTPPYHYEGDAHTPSNQRTVESLTWSNDPRYNFLQPNTPQPNIPQRNIPQGNILQGNNLQVNIPEPGISWNSSGQIPYESHNISYWSKKTKRPLRGNLTDHQFLLLCPATLAFALKTKQWVTIQPDYITEVEPSNESLDHLVLGPSELSTIKALATRQNSKRDIWAADFIEGKGTGQIILLHGPPGVGKTYTVEAIAQYLHRPLLALTVADIGTLETRVEQELLKWFSLAEAWDAILLVDEADIFLERRQNRDLARNAFLRRMEYFKGLLFLTTNRVGHIDDAFISRIHVAIGYESFSPESRSQIWKGFFRKLSEERAGKIQIAQGAKKWVLDKALSGTAQLNGRDIRNALQTAITLAEAEYEEDPEFNPDTTTIVVDQSHFKRVLGITNKFRAYVESIRREDEKKRAAGRHDRNDYWEDEQNTGARP